MCRQEVRSVFLSIILFFCSIDLVFGLGLNEVLSDLDLHDANDNPAKIPDFGRKVLAIIYADPEAADENDPLSDALDAANFDGTKFHGMGVANLKDTWKPNMLVRMIIRRKIEKYKCTILTDPDGVLPQRWKLGEVNNSSIAMIIGRDRTVKYFKKGAVLGKEIDQVLKLIGRLIAE